MIGLTAHAGDDCDSCTNKQPGSFVPSHALSAKLRFEAKRAGLDYKDHTQALPPLTDDTREFYRARTQANTDARVNDLLAQYETQYTKHVEHNNTPQQTLLDRIDQLEQKIDDANKTSATDTSDSTLMQAAIGGGGMLAGLASAGLFFRRRKQLELTNNL